MNVTKITSREDEKQNALHDWIDAEVPQMIDDEVASQQTEIIFDKQ